MISISPSQSAAAATVPACVAKSDQRCFVAEALAAKLADIQLVTDNTHFGMASVADVRVVCPYHSLGIRAHLSQGYD